MDNKVQRIRHLQFNGQDENIPAPEIPVWQEIDEAEQSSKDSSDRPEMRNYDSFSLNNLNAGIGSQARQITSHIGKNITGSGPNSLAAVFNNQNHAEEEKFTLQRVFRKSVGLLILSLVLFLILSFFSVQFFFLLSSNFILSLFILPLLVACMVAINLFYLLLADRSYLWISLLSQGAIILFNLILMGQIFNFTALLLTALALLLFYLSYSELEKVQLSSRLFSISQVTAESSRILLTGLILLFCALTYGQIISTSTVNGNFTDSTPYFSRVFLENDFIMDNFIIGGNGLPGLNLVFLNGRYFINDGQIQTIASDGSGQRVPATMKELLTDNYKPGELLWSPEENTAKLNACAADEDTDCDRQIEATKEDRLREWQAEFLPNISYDLNQDLSLPEFREVVKSYYENWLSSFNQDVEDNLGILPSNLILAPKHILPLGLILIIFIGLTILRPVISFLQNFSLLIIWQLLKATGFVKVNIETVEAEIVSI